MSRPPGKPHPANVPGDFYVEDACCLTCGIPEHVAPEIFKWADDSKQSQCVVSQQPRTPAELDRTLDAMECMELDCIRYRGNDPEIGRYLVDAGLADQCDVPVPRQAKRLMRSCVTFQAVPGMQTIGLEQIINEFLQSYKQHYDAPSRNAGGDITSIDSTRAIIELHWHKDIRHVIEFRASGPGKWIAIVGLKPGFATVGLPRVLQKWFKDSPHFEDVQWF